METHPSKDTITSRMTYLQYTLRGHSRKIIIQQMSFWMHVRKVDFDSSPATSFGCLILRILNLWWILTLCIGKTTQMFKHFSLSRACDMRNKKVAGGDMHWTSSYIYRLKTKGYKLCRENVAHENHLPLGIWKEKR